MEMDFEMDFEMSEPRRRKWGVGGGGSGGKT